MNIERNECPCGKPIKIKGPGLCGTCYGRQWRSNTLVRTAAKKSETIKQRLYQRFDLDPNSGCWLWTGTITQPGKYGELWYKNKKHRVHVLSYQLHIGTVPKGLFVLHKCDVPYCVNPNHLFVGTNTDNMLDCAKKGRIASRKLTEKQVIAIRNMSDTTSRIATSFGICGSTVRSIKTRRTWSWLETA